MSGIYAFSLNGKKVEDLITGVTSKVVYHKQKQIQK
jgi:hypothetical protein